MGLWKGDTGEHVGEPVGRIGVGGHLEQVTVVENQSSWEGPKSGTFAREGDCWRAGEDSAVASYR